MQTHKLVVTLKVDWSSNNEQWGSEHGRACACSESINNPFIYTETIVYDLEGRVWVPLFIYFLTLIPPYIIHYFFPLMPPSVQVIN